MVLAINRQICFHFFHYSQRLSLSDRSAEDDQSERTRRRIRAYKALVGCVLYAAISTRVDIAFDPQLARYLYAKAQHGHHSNLDLQMFHPARSFKRGIPCHLSGGSRVTSRPCMCSSGKAVRLPLPLKLSSAALASIQGGQNIKLES